MLKSNLSLLILKKIQAEQYQQVGNEQNNPFCEFSLSPTLKTVS